MPSLQEVFLQRDDTGAMNDEAIVPGDRDATSNKSIVYCKSPGIWKPTELSWFHPFFLN